MKLSSIGIGLLCLAAARLDAQPHSRSGFERPSGIQSVNSLPCAGSLLFSEDFESGSSSWTILDLDGNTPNVSTGLVGGWQERADYYDSTNTVMVSPSWYSPVDSSDDWLISPAVTLGSNPCLSWTAYSKDLYYKEAYEIRISNTTADTAGFLAEPVMLSIAEESEVPTTRSISLADYAGQTVFVAFRQVSNDEFVLVLDDITVSNVNNIDVGVVAFDAPVSDPGDTLEFTVEVGNFGSDTISSFTISYSIEGGPVETMQVSGISLAPSALYTFTHTDSFISAGQEAFYDFCAWTSLPNGVADEDVSNDSLCDRFAVGTPVSNGQIHDNLLSVSCFPNPASGSMEVVVNGSPAAGIAFFQLRDLSGRLIWEESRSAGSTSRQVKIPQQVQGIYFLQVEIAGRRASQKVVFH